MKCMKLGQVFLMACLFAGSTWVQAAPPVEVVSPTTNINMFINSSGVAIPTSSYTPGVHATYGNVEFLKSGSPGYGSGTTTVQQRLQSTLSMTNKTLASLTFASAAHQRISENSILPGQCVAFAKSMASPLRATADWRAGRSLNVIFPGGTTQSGTANTKLVPGSVIAHFGGKATYGSNTSNPHVVVVLSVFEQGGVVRGINVVDQNGMNSATINGVNTSVISGGGGTIAKHFLPWDAKNVSYPQLSAKNYNVVAQCASGNTCN